MKNTDIAAVILIASLSVLVAYFVADRVIGQPGAQSVKVKTVDAIQSTVTDPDPSIFNKDAINPTIPVVIGEGAAAVPRDDSKDKNKITTTDRQADSTSTATTGQPER